MVVVEAKRNLRKRMLSIRDGIDENVRMEKNEKIASRMKEFLIKNDVKTLLLYASYKSEVDTWSIFEFCRQRNIETAFPKVNKKENKIEIYWVESLDDLISGFKSILEPKTNKKADIKEFNFIIVPGLAFDKKCYRMGYGGGYYDRLLSKKEFGISIGLAYEEQIVDRLPVEFHDIKVDLIITDEREINCV